MFASLRHLTAVAITNALASGDGTVVVKAMNTAKVYDGSVSLCKSLQSDTYTCPSAGTYTVDSFDLTLPGDSNSWYSSMNLWGMTVGVTANFDFSGSYTQCTMNVKASKYSGYTLVGGAMVLAGLATVVGLRRRRVATIQLPAEEGTHSHFEMMTSDAGVRV